MPQKSTDKMTGDLFRDEADRLQKCLQLIELISEKQIALSRSDRNTICISLSQEQLEFLEHCVNLELCNTIEDCDLDIYDEEDDDDY